MSAYVIAGLVLGGIYAISALGLTLTYASSRIFNFGHGAIAFWVASCYYQFHSRMGWSMQWAAFVAVVVIGPLTGLFLWAVLFRRLVHASSATKLVSTIGLFVAIPPFTLFVFDDQPIFRAPGLAGESPSVHHLLGVAINADQIIVLASALVVAVGMAAVLRSTAFGLSVRAVVDSPVLSELVGVNTSIVSAGAWAIGCLLAGLAGVLVAPIIGLGPNQFAALVISSFAAVVVARMRSLPGAFAGALMLGVVQGVSVKYLPSEGLLSRGIRPSIPFFVMGVFLFIYGSFNRGNERKEADDRSAINQDAPEVAERSHGRGRFVLQGLALAVVLTLPLLLRESWVGVIAGGIALGVILLSITIVTGEGGMISFCQITFAGIGAVTTAQLATNFGWPLPLAIVAGGLAAVPFGLLLAVLALRLGDLYLALATLAFAVLMDNLVFQIQRFSNFGLGVEVQRPVIASLSFDSDVHLYYLLLAVFGLIALGTLNLRRSTTGLALAAVRSSEMATATLGISIVRAKIIAFSMSAFVAGLGGGLWATYQRIADPPAFSALVGVVWLALVVVWGIRSSFGALLGGITLPVIAQFVSQHFDASFAQLTPVLFGLLAIGLAREPRGIVMMSTVFLRKVRRRVLLRNVVAAVP